MLFRITEHYDIYNNDYSILDDEIYCLICHDKAYLQKHIKLNSNKYYFKKCKCDGYIHKNCLDKWLNLNMSCPYCRKEIELNNSLFKKIIIFSKSCFCITIPQSLSFTLKFKKTLSSPDETVSKLSSIFNDRPSSNVL